MATPSNSPSRCGVVGALGHGIGAQLFQQRRQHAVAGGVDLLAQALEQVVAPLAQVDDPAAPGPCGCRLRRSTLTCPCSSAGSAPASRCGSMRVARQQVPVPVHRQRGVRLVALEDQLHRLTRGRKRRVVQRAFAVHRRVAGGHEQRVALAQRHVQPLGQAQHHLAAGSGAAGFHEAQVAGGNLGFLRQVELAQAPVLAPMAQVLAKRPGRRSMCGLDRGVHGAIVGPAPPSSYYLPRNRPAAAAWRER